MIFNDIFRSEARNQVNDIIFRLGRQANMDDVGVHHTQSLHPCGAAVRISDQLRFVNDRRPEMPCEITKLDRGTDDLSVILQNRFLACYHAARDSRGVDFVRHFQRKQTQRPEIGSGRILFQIFHCVVCFPAVGRPYMQDKVAAQFLRLCNIIAWRIAFQYPADLLFSALLRRFRFPLPHIFIRCGRIQSLLNLFFRP